MFNIKRHSIFVQALFFFLFAILSACGNNAANGDCSIGEPRAMFSNNLNGISEYQFSVKGQESSETFLFHGTPISVEQSGCDLIKQQFQFQATKGKSSAELIDEIVKHLINFAQLGNEQAAFLAWSQAIDELKPEIKISEPFSPARGIEITIDRIQQVDNDLLLLKLEMSQI